MEILDLPNNNTNLTGDPNDVLWAKTKANFEELTLTVSGVNSDAADAQADIDALVAFNDTLGGTTMSTNTYKKLVSITSANILAMNGTPVVVLASPGAGKAIMIKSCVAILDSTVTAYANGGVAYLSYGNTTPITNNVAATFFTGGDKVFSLNPLAAAGGINMLVNTAVTITNDTAPFITGTGVLRLLVEYDVITTGL